MDMLYEIKNLSFSWLVHRNFRLYITVNCSINLTDWEVDRGCKGVPYNGGQNLPEPEETPTCIVLDWEFASDVEVIARYDYDGEEFRFSIKAKPETPMESFLLHMIRDQIMAYAEWGEIGNELYNYIGE